MRREPKVCCCVYRKSECEKYAPRLRDEFRVVIKRLFRREIFRIINDRSRTNIRPCETPPRNEYRVAECQNAQKRGRLEHSL